MEGVYSAGSGQKLKKTYKKQKKSQTKQNKWSDILAIGEISVLNLLHNKLGKPESRKVRKQIRNHQNKNLQRKKQQLQNPLHPRNLNDSQRYDPSLRREFRKSPRNPRAFSVESGTLFPGHSALSSAAFSLQTHALPNHKLRAIFEMGRGILDLVERIDVELQPLFKLH